MADDPNPKTTDHSKTDNVTRLFVHVQQACRAAAVEAFEDAQIRGLCAEGAFEAAMQAIDQLKIDLLKKDLLKLQQTQTNTRKDQGQG